MAFADLTARLNLNTANFSAALTSASMRMKAFSKGLTDSYTEASKELKKHTLDLKDTARIIQGIVVSQAFYNVARSISDATSALMTFNEQLDYAHVTYSALFGDPTLASEFVSALQAKSVDTIFEYSDLADAAKKLLAYGIEYENLMYIMDGLTNMGAMSGDKDAMTRMARALGQIYTKGKLSAEEMRQLADAYVPIYDIIQSSFGLSDDQMGRVGDLKLPAEDVINAIVEYANEKFGGVGDAAMYTITGLKNRVVDTMKVMGSEMLQPFTVAWKSFLAYVADGLLEIRGLYSSGGWGGVFEHLVPDPAQQTIVRAFLANIHNLIMTITSSLSTLFSILGTVGQTFMIVFNLVAPAILGVVNVLSLALRAINENATAAAILRAALVGAAGAFIVLRAQAAAAMVMAAVTKVVMGLSKALLLLSAIISRNWILFGLFAIGAALIGVSAASNNANNSLSGLFKTISGIGGITNQEDIFKKTETGLNNSATAADKFNNKLGEGIDAADELSDRINGVGGAADKAAKKTGGLLSFDEVFKLPDSSSGSGSGSGAGAGLLGDMENLAAGLGALGDSLIPEIPDFTDFIDGFTDGLFGGLEQGIMDKLVDTAIGALLGAGIGAIIGGLLGGPAGAVIGAKIGALAGGITGLFWDEIKEALGTTNTGMLGTALAGALGAGLGFSVGGVPGALIGGTLGLLAGGLATKLWSQIAEALGRGPESAHSAQIGSSIGMGLGGILGFVIGGPGGALLGAGIGTLIGGLVGMFKDKIVEFFTSDRGMSITWGASIGASIGAVVIPGPIGAAIGTLVGGLLGFFGDKIRSNWGAITEAFSEKWAEISANANTWFEDLKFGTEIALSVIKENWSTKWNEISSAAYTKWEEMKTSANTWFDDLKYGTVLALSVIKENWSTKWNEIKANASAKWSEIRSDAIAWWVNLKSDTASSLGSIAATWSTKWRDIKSAASIIWSEIKSAASTWWTNFKTDTSNGINGIKATWANKWNEIKSQMSLWWSGLKTSMGTWLESNVWKPISDFFNINTFWNRISSLLGQIKRKLSNWWDGITDLFDFNVSVGANVNMSANSRGVSAELGGHAAGGIFNREHIARFAEGNRAEAVIPLENQSAMQPFVNAIARGIIEGIAPVLVQPSSRNDLPPMYVGTLIADERGIKQLYKKFEVIRAQEDARRGTD